jgi:hypothetical protein
MIENLDEYLTSNLEEHSLIDKVYYTLELACYQGTTNQLAALKIL